MIPAFFQVPSTVVADSRPFEKCKYLACRDSKKNRMHFFLVHLVESEVAERERHKYSLYLQKYLVMDWDSKGKDIVALLGITGDVNCLIDLQQRDKQNQFFLQNFQPFATCFLPELSTVRRYRMKNWKWPEDGKIYAKKLMKQQKVWVLPEENGPLLYSFTEIELNGINDLEEIGNADQAETKKRVWAAWFKGRFDVAKTELKNSNSIIFKNFQPLRGRYPLVDKEKKYCILKGLAYGFEEIGDRYWLILSPTNFSRSYGSIVEMKLKGPIDHRNRRFVSIHNGLPLQKRFQNFEEIKNAVNYFETFDTSDSRKARADGLQGEFSKPAHYFSQSNLADATALIEATKDNANPGIVPISLDEVGLPPSMKFRIIRQRKNLVFGNGELHWTVGKGLHHAGVLKLPKLKEIGIIHSGNAVQDSPR